MKGYKITAQGCVCDSCFETLFANKVYEYGCGSEHHGGYEGVEAAIEQMYRANRLWNALVEIDRYERTEYRRLATDPTLEADIKAAEQRKEDLRLVVKKQRQQEQKKRVAIDPAITSELQQVKARLKQLYAQNKARAAATKTANAPALEQLKTDVAAKIERATDPATCGLVWTMIEPLRARFNTASARAKKEGAQLKFHRFDGSGHIVVPFTNGLSLSKAHQWKDDSGKFQIASSLMSAHPREGRTLCRIAVTTNNKKPVWLTVPVVLHRPLPTDADIRTVMICREVVGGKARWKI